MSLCFSPALQFQSIADQLFQSFNSTVSITNFDALSSCIISWLEEYCKPQVCVCVCVRVCVCVGGGGGGMCVCVIHILCIIIHTHSHYGRLWLEIFNE